MDNEVNWDYHKARVQVGQYFRPDTQRFNELHFPSKYLYNSGHA